jgi:multicomponent Na+:H+ antiporter subunit D
MIGGLCLKSALFPLHGWLPPAYAGAPTYAAVLLAGLIGKAPLYLLLRLWFEMVPPALRPTPGLLLGALGAAAVLWTSLVALRQSSLKRLLAYSSLGQLGYLFLALTVGSDEAWAGAVYLLVAHAAASAAMFMAVGVIEGRIHDDRISALEGLARHLPASFFTMALAGLTLMGLPPSGGFVAKWLLVRAAVEAERWAVVGVLVVGSVLAAGYVFRVLKVAFRVPSTAGPGPGRDSDAAPPGTSPRGAVALALLLAFASVALGVAADLPLSLLAGGPR